MRISVYREGSVVPHFWIVLSVPSSHVGQVTVRSVAKNLQNGLRRFKESDNNETACLNGYVVPIDSVAVRGESDRRAEEQRLCA